MSVFDLDNDDVHSSVQFFNDLPEDKKIKIVSDLNPSRFKQNQEYEPLLPLLSKIQQDISQHDAIEIGTKLMEYGLEETFARLFVANVKKHAPTHEYEIRQINKIPDDVFCQKLPDIAEDALVKGHSPDALSERYSIDKETISCIVNNMGRSLDKLARGDATKDHLDKTYRESISAKKADVLLNQIFIRQKHHFDTTLFSNMQDNLQISYKIRRQNAEIIRVLQEFLKLAKQDFDRRQ